MKTLPVIPHVGIGPLKLGMSPEQIIDILNQMRPERALPDYSYCPNYKEIDISERIDEIGLTELKYQDVNFFFMVRYQNNKAAEIAVDYQLRESRLITLYDIDVFKTPAEQLVTSLKQFSSCSCDSEDEQLGNNYEFDDIGIRLWREEVFHPKFLSDEKYMKEMALIIDEMYHYLYFEIIAVRQ